MHKLRAFLFCSILLLGLWALAASSPEDFLHEQKLIRVYVDAAPGFGHQSAGISVMRRMREMGFDGQFEVVYQEAVEAKIKKIYPSFPEGIEGQIRYVGAMDYVKNFAQVEHVNIAVSGADDGSGDSFRKVAKAYTYLRLQPLGWGQSAMYGKETKVLGSLQNLPLTNLNSPKQEQFKELVRTNSDLSPDKKEFVFKFAELAANNLSFPVYGVGIQTYAPQRMYFYGKAVKSAAQKINSDKAVIVPVLSPFNAQEMDTMNKVFGKTAGFEAATAAELKHQKQMHLMTPAEFAALPQVKPGHVYFVFVGSVPQAVFNFFYEQANLPVWVAGKNAMSFAVTKGKPYFNTVDDYFLPEKNKLSAASIKVLEKAQQGFTAGYMEFANQGSLRAVTQFILEASSPGTELEAFFHSLGEKMSSNDKVREGLRHAIDSGPAPLCSQVFN
ncbi:MAG: hypothetical protein J7501_08555 [Bdellovibrio sp.]|nr:hypothetical protein [Bdellovibrio sp.]